MVIKGCASWERMVCTEAWETAGKGNRVSAPPGGEDSSSCVSQHTRCSLGFLHVSDTVPGTVGRTDLPLRGGAVECGGRGAGRVHP